MRSFRAYAELTKPRIALMVLVTAYIGWRLAGGRGAGTLSWMLLGTGLSALCAGSLNQYLERGKDALMRRTRTRPLPQGRLRPGRALAFGLACGLAGAWVLSWRVNALSAGLALATLCFYLLIYTPLKPVTPHSTWIGAAAGATGPLIGWAAARGELSPAAWALFAIQFLWQIPHFMAIFWMCREDYARAGFRVMPVLDPGGGTTACQIALHSFALLLASLVPALCGLAGTPYGLWALALGAAFLGLGMRASWTMALLDTRRLFLASLAYLPLLFGALVLCQPA